MSRDRHNTIRPTHLYGSDWRVGEYLCPLCQRLSNTVLPLLPQPGASSSLAIDPTQTAQIDFVEWLQCLEQFSSTAQTQRAADGQQSIVSTSTSNTTADDLTGHNPDNTAFPVTTGSQANVAQQDELRQLSPLSIGILARFCKDTHKVLAGSLPVRSSVSAAETFIVAQTQTQSDSSTDSDSDSDTATAAVLSECGVGACKSLVSVLRCCGYTFRCWERHLDGQNAAVLTRPERGSLASLSLLARVAASVCVHRGGRSCGTPLLTGIASLLLALARRQRPTRLAALTCDAFELMLMLTASLAAAQVARVSSKWRYISGSPEDQHVVRLCLLLCITQALLTSTNQRAPTTPVAMETDDVTSSADSNSQWLLEFYAHTSCMIQREADRISAADFLLHVWSFIRPFLRCCALVFHHMTGVQAPGDLTQSPPTWRDNASECRSLLCYLDIKLATVPVLFAVNLARRWMDQLAYCQTSSSGRSPASQSVQQALPPVASLIPNPRVRVVLIDLPQDYSDLILKATRVTCGCEAAAHSAKVSVSSPTLCLLCGAVLCSEVTCANPDSSSKLPRGRRPRGGMDGHALVCGAGVALFLVVRRCKLYLVHSTETSFRRAQVAPPYVDRFGESDEGLRRGVALSLRNEHMRRLCLLYSTHSVAAQVSRHVEDFTSRQMAMLD